MKTIGIVGGIGPESTVDYYNTIIGAFNSKYPDLAYPEIIIYSINLNRLMRIVESEDWIALADWLLEKITALHGAGADFAAIASNTPHIVFKEIQSRSPVPLLSIIEQTRNKACSLGLKNVGLLGTKLSMEGSFYKEPFVSKGISVVVPTEKERQLIHHRLFSEIELGVFKDSTKNELLGIVERMVNDEGIDSLVLGCTELPLILTEDKFGIPFLNSTAIHCESIISYCIA